MRISSPEVSEGIPAGTVIPSNAMEYCFVKLLIFLVVFFRFIMKYFYISVSPVYMIIDLTFTLITASGN